MTSSLLFAERPGDIKRVRDAQHDRAGSEDAPGQAGVLLESVSLTRTG